MLLAEGHLLYGGPAGAVVGWMARFGLQVPFGTSIAGARAAGGGGGGRGRHAASGGFVWTAGEGNVRQGRSVGLSVGRW
jgi:hypothetical protein